MRDNLKICMWKICIFVLAVLLVWQVGRLLINEIEREMMVEHFVVTDNVGVLGISGSEDFDNQSMGASIVQDQSQQLEADFKRTNFDKIRVVLTNQDTGSIYHKDVTYFLEPAGMQGPAEGLEPMVVQEHADYRGTLEILETEAGYVVINELPLEEYLYSVVPSEMPASYPMEALKAQAICARTYAYLHILSPGYPQWNAHVDDTTAFQVYHSVEEQESTTRAVNETEGVVLLAPGGMSLAQTYYYSTSCGYGSDAHVWRTKYSDSYPYITSRHINREVAEEAVVAMVQEVGGAGSAVLQGDGLMGQHILDEDAFAAYIKATNSADYEAQESWYRWSYDVKKADTEHMLHSLQKRYEANPELVLTLQGSAYVSRPIEELDVLVDLVIEKREAGGVADELLIITENNVYKVITELNIRYVLIDGKTRVLRQDGSEVAMNSLLPSAFIVLENQYNNGEMTGYHIIGGGFGHGAGMSQNAAKAMAQEGMSAEEILTFFFADCTLEKK